MLVCLRKPQRVCSQEFQWNPNSISKIRSVQELMLRDDVVQVRGRCVLCVFVWCVVFFSVCVLCCVLCCVFFFVCCVCCW